MMSKQNKTLTKRQLKSLLTGSIVAFIVAISPFIFYSYNSFPETKVWETFLFTYESQYYGSVYVAMWTFMGKAIPLLLLVLWFFTCKHWWYHVILIPISMYSFQLFTSLNEDIKYFDELEIWYIFPLMLIIIPFIYIIRAKLFMEITDESLEEFEHKLGAKRNIFQQIGDLFR